MRLDNLLARIETCQFWQSALKINYSIASNRLNSWQLHKKPHVHVGLFKIKLVRVDGIEPTTSAWKADVLPLNYTRSN